MSAKVVIMGVAGCGRTSVGEGLAMLTAAGPGGEDQSALTEFFDGRIHHHVTGANYFAV